jgi:hypothetical protein
MISGMESPVLEWFISRDLWSRGRQINPELTKVIVEERDSSGDAEEGAPVWLEEYCWLTSNLSQLVRWKWGVGVAGSQRPRGTPESEAVCVHAWTHKGVGKEPVEKSWKEKSSEEGA